MQSKRVLVTGAGGFTGRYVCQELCKYGFEPFGLTTDGDLAGRRVDIVNYEEVLASVETVKPDYVIHLAGIAYVGHGDPSDFYRVNVIGTRNLLEALKKTGTVKGKVILASSANVYGNRYGDRLLTEDLPVAPVNDYGVSKAAMELLANLYAGDLPIVIARPFNYTGVGQSENFLVPKIVKGFRERAGELNLGNLNIARDFSDVRDIAKIYRIMLRTEFVGIVNFCSGKAYKLMDIVDMCRSLTGYNLMVKSSADFERKNEINTVRGSSKIFDKAVGYVNRFELGKTIEWMFE